jgi:hypothetical protein
MLNGVTLTNCELKLVNAVVFVVSIQFNPHHIVILPLKGYLMDKNQDTSKHRPNAFLQHHARE